MCKHGNFKKVRKTGQFTAFQEEKYNDKNTICLPRQCLRDGMTALILLGFLDGSVEFTPYLHLWKIGSV